MDAPAEVATISVALVSKRTGSPPAYMRLLRTLAGRDAPAIARILTGLTHFAAAAHASPVDADAADVRALIDAALHVDLHVCATPVGKTQDHDEMKVDKEAECTYPALEALTSFLTNLVSANATYVDAVLRLCARRAFTLPMAVRSRVITAMYTTIHAILHAHPRAVSLLAAVVCDCYPHPVRPPAEHASYARSVLHVARECPSGGVGRSVVSTVFERLGAVEALVGDDLFQPGDETELTVEASRVEVIMLELFRHMDITHAESREDYVQTLFEPMFAAYEASIVPMEGARFSPYTILYAASLGGPHVLEDAADRMRLSFCDSRLSSRLRVHFLQHSSLLVALADGVSPAAAHAWLAHIARWLNGYIDSHELGSARMYAVVDTDIHQLFYAACCALMVTAVRRPDALDSRSNVCGADAVDRMRLLRIMACSMNPLLVLPSDVVREFAHIVFEESGMDLTEIVEENKRQFKPSRTRYGKPNTFSYVQSYSKIELPIAWKKLSRFVRLETRIDADDNEIGEGIAVPEQAPTAMLAAMESV